MNLGKTRQSKNTFEIDGDRVVIKHPDWDFIALASIKDEYVEELQSVTWSKKADIYIARSWAYIFTFTL